LDSRPLQSKVPATRIMKLLGAFAASIFAIAIPFGYYMLSVSEIRESLAIETAFLAKSVEKVIQTRPDMWEFESMRLQEIVSQPALDGKPCERIIRNAAGTVVAKTDIAARRPVISTSVALFDSGRSVGSFEARHSIRTPVVFTVLFGIFSSLLGYLIYYIFRTYPIKKLDSTLADLRRAGEELRESEEKYRNILENIEDGYFEVDLAGNFTFFNPSHCRIFGYPREEIQGMNYRVFTDAENAKKVFRTFNEVYVTGIPSKGFEWETIRKDGAKTYIDVSVSLIARPGEKPTGFHGIVRDITKRKKAEQEKDILADIGRLIGSTLDIEEVYEQFSAKVRKLIPFDRLTINLFNFQENTARNAYIYGEDVPGRRPGESYPLTGTVSEAVIRARTGLIIQLASPEEMARLYPTSIVSTFQAGLRSMMSVPLIYRDTVIGALHFLSKMPNSYPEQDLWLAERIGAQIAGAIANARLFTELKKTERSLRESEGRFRALVEQAAVGVAEIKMSTGQFITVNRRLCEMVGRTEEEMLATTFQAITHPEDLHLHEEIVALLLAGKIDHSSLEKRYLRKDGEIVWVNITVSPLRKPGEKPGRNMTVVEDITERKRMEAEMREMSLRDQLTDLYNRRGFITLAEQQLKAANRAQRPLLLTFIDCDGLKWINDTQGHKEGDKALIDTTHILRQTFRESDIIARLGGDEFAILSIDAADLNQGDFSRRLQQHIDAFNAKESRPYKLSLSWGAAIYNPESPLSLDELISAADGLMYAQKKAKARGRRL